MPIALYLKVAAVLSVVGLLTWVGMKIDAGGYNRAIADMSKGQQQREAQIAKGFVQAVSDAERKRSDALDELDKLRSRPPVVITDVQTEIIERNVCRSFDRDFIGLLDAT